MRIVTVVNCPRDLACNARLPNLGELQDKARAINRRILEAERAGQATVLASPAFERIAHPSTDADGRRTPALRFGDPRVTALAGALASTLTAATGITSKTPRLDLRAAARFMHSRPDDLRPAQAPPRGPHPPDRAHQPVRPDPGRDQVRRLLHQAPQPAAPPPHGRRPATGTTPAKTGPGHPEPVRR